MDTQPQPVNDSSVLGAGQARRWAWGLLGGGLTLLGVVGQVVSFARVEHEMRRYFGALSWTVPIGVDLGIAVITGLDLLMAYDGIRTRWLRVVPWSLTAVTVYLNTVGEPTVEGKVAHAVLPLLWVVAVEVIAGIVKRRVGLGGKRKDTPDESGSSLLWLLAPVSTLKLRRRMALTSTASDQYVDGLIVAARLKDEYGVLLWRLRMPLLWRWRMPREKRVLFRHGRLTPTGVVTEVPAPPAPGPDGHGYLSPAGEQPGGPGQLERAASVAAPETPALPPPPSARPTAKLARSLTDAEALEKVSEIAREIGRAPGAPMIKKRLGVGSAKATALAAAYKANPNGHEPAGEGLAP
jgi:Protein of unknown function (DUF2637)